MTDNIITPTTPEQKLKVLKDARAKLKNGFTRYAWCKLIDGVEHYCLYGAVEAAMGYDLVAMLRDEVEQQMTYRDEMSAEEEEHQLREWMRNPEDLNYNPELDDEVSACSLTTTMYEAGVKCGVVTPMTEEQAKGKMPMTWKVSRLQAVNDSKGLEAVLEVLDQAIEDLQAEVDE